MEIRSLLVALSGVGLLALGACRSADSTEVSSYQVIPLPYEIQSIQGKPFVLNAQTRVAYPAQNDKFRCNAEFLSSYIAQSTGYELPLMPYEGEVDESQVIVLALDPTVEKQEGYHLQVDERMIRVAGATEQGVFYGIQTLRKAIPAVAEGQTIRLDAVDITDAPRFEYRAMHLDVCRHFFPLDFVKKYIDLLAMHNMNKFHFHLTDDQGWRIEIKKYPRLTEVGSIRHRSVVGYCGSGVYDTITVQGFYTQEQLRELVQYAAERYVTIIPEVDLPGHMLAALASYPELGCTGGPYEVCPDWGVFPDVLCIGNEKTFDFIEGVLTEVMDIFPSQYIHIGGDEIPRTRWQQCPKCQARIRQEGLRADKEFTAEDRLQSYCMARVERFLQAHGREAIGWDEVLNGDVPPGVTVMSWQGTAGGIKAAKMGHKVIMAPNSYCYFDYYQTAETETEPLSIGGCVTLDKVYHFDPIAGLTDEEARYVWGVQANMWVEYIPTTSHVEYMLLPRLAALAEVQWGRADAKDYEGFKKRLIPLMKFYERDGLNFAKHLYEVNGQFAMDTLKRTLSVTLSTLDDAPIYYTLDGSEPTSASARYQGPLVITQGTDLKAVAIRNSSEGQQMSRVWQREIGFNKATLRPISFLSIQPEEKYTFAGPITLVDGLKGKSNFSTGAWLGFLGDVTAQIDLGSDQEISQVSVEAMTYMDAWIMGLSQFTVETSLDGVHFQKVLSESYDPQTDPKQRTIDVYALTFEPLKARYVRLTMKRQQALPKGHDGAGGKPFLFLDEIVIE